MSWFSSVVTSLFTDAPMPGGPLAERVGELAVGVELHRLDADREVGEPLADHRIVGRRAAVALCALRAGAAGR